MYKYGIRNGTLQRGWKDALETAGVIGFDGVELTVKEQSELDRLLTEAGRDKVLGWVESSGCAVSSLSISLFGPYKAAAGDAAQRAEILKTVEGSLKACKDLNGVGILLPFFEREHIDITAEEEARLIEDMKKVAPVAESLEVMVCLETSFSSAQLKRVCDGVGSKWVGVYQDIGNALHFGHDSVEMLTSLPKETLMIHVKDYQGDQLGEGRVDFPGCRKAIRDIGYEGWLVFETRPNDDAVESARVDLAYAKKAFD